MNIFPKIGCLLTELIWNTESCDDKRYYKEKKCLLCELIAILETEEHKIMKKIETLI